MNEKLTVKQFFEDLESNEDFKYIVHFTNEFKKSVKLSFKRNLDLNLLKDVILMLAMGKKLKETYRSHKLNNYYKLQKNQVVMECHIQPDWLFVWMQNDAELTLLLIDTGTHSDLFG